MPRVFGASLEEIDPHPFTRLVERLLWHLDFRGVSNVDGSGDGGADLVANHGDDRWVVQVKSKQSGSVDAGAVDEVLRGMQRFGARQGLVVTNRTFSSAAKARCADLVSATNVGLHLWSGNDLMDLVQDPEVADRILVPELRPYQVDAFEAARHDLETRGAALLVLATGLGKTVIAGELIDWFLQGEATRKVLVLADKRDLVDQLERALWRHLPKNIATQQLKGAEKPNDLSGVTVATVQSAISYLRDGYRPDLIFIDEAHHVGADSLFAEALELCEGVPRFGATATPWRGDEFDVANIFGPASYTIGIAEGMRLGYLADVDYRIFFDNIDWSSVRTLSRNRYTIANLNRQLFLPQRDEQIRDELLSAWFETEDPRGIVFCSTIEHAEAFLAVVRAVPCWSNAAAIHNRMDKNEQRVCLAKFRLGDIPLLVAVDKLNEGVDVPDVNIVCFARVTHSRRIFVQQLGRGLRLSPGKSKVVVLDFVSDLRRTKAVLSLRASVTGDKEVVVLPSSHSFRFSNEGDAQLLDQWLSDVADLETAADEVKLDFPPLP